MERGLFRGLILIFLLITVIQLGAQDIPVQRYALIVGSNFGGNDTVNLKYSANDARAFSSLLSEIGGIPEENKLLLMNPEKSMLTSSFDHLRQIIANTKMPGSRIETIFYYSGHSDEEGLLLFGEKYNYETLKESVNNLPSEVRIVILDSCSSGAFTRTKGGKIKPPFLMDTANISKGHAYLTSSTATEDSQESDTIQSSFFTYALISGLRGAADSNGDGNVNLNEAYQYAFDETINRTSKTSAGVQHPAYEINLSGTGNIVLTNIRENSSRLVLEKNIRGLIFIKDTSARLVAEFFKEQGKETEISLSPGLYTLHLDDGNNLYSQEFTLRSRGIFTLSSPDKMKVERKERMKSKGSNALHHYFDWTGYQSYDDDNITRFSANLFIAQSVTLYGAMVSLLSNNLIQEGRGYQGAIGFNTVGSDFFGFQSSLFYNRIEGNLTGIQMSAVNHTIGSTLFGQIAGIGNITEGDTYGAQISGAFNYSNHFSGLQLAPVNISKTFSGLQMGLVNYTTRGTGVQLGLINISDELKGVPIGLLDFQKKGENHLEIMAENFLFNSESAPPESYYSVGYRLGSRYFYKALHVGFKAPGSGDSTESLQGLPLYSCTIGMGFRLPIIGDTISFLSDVNAGLSNQTPEINLGGEENNLEDYLLATNRLILEWKWGPHFGLIAGINSRVYFEGYNDKYLPASHFVLVNSSQRVFLDSRPFIGLEF